MKKYKILAFFDRNDLIFPKIELVENDYNSIELDFEFDIEDGKKVFELKKPNGKVFVKEIIDNKVILYDTDENGNIIPLISQSGIYEFEVSLYTNDSKLTINKSCQFFARDEVVNIDDDVVDKDARLPILDDLINKTNEVKGQIETLGGQVEEQGNYAKKQGNYAKEQGDYAKETTDTLKESAENGDFNGATFKPNVDSEGNLSWTNDKELENPETQNIRGPKGEKGDCNFATFSIENGNLVMNKTDNLLLDFGLNERGELEVFI